MNYPNNIEEILGINDLKNHLITLCNSQGGKKLANDIVFSTQKSTIKNNHQLYSNYIRYVELGNNLMIYNQSDVSDSLKHVFVENFYLEEDTLIDINQVFLKIKEVIENFEGLEEEIPFLWDLLKPLHFPKELSRQLGNIFDNENQIKANASTEFKKLHQVLNTTQLNIRKSMQGAFRLAKKNGWLAAENIALRANRLVLPIIPEHKNKIKGYLIDESSKNRILFIEPVEAFDLNNNLAEIYLDIRKERIKILKKITREVAKEKHSILQINKVLNQLDLIQAKKELYSELNGSMPLFSDNEALELIQAKNPLLFLRYRKEGKDVVPFSLSLDKEKRILVISGPNAGGKSVLLKSVLVLQYMFQCGLPISAQPGSSFPIYKHIIVDFGDNQSQENDLSSYSSHLQAMKFFMSNATNKTLFGIDELGSGTDPQLGGAIGQAILENLYNKKSMGVVNTHFSSIKNMASNKDSFLSGSMLFDLDKLKPLYELQIGNAGSSFAFELAYSLGMNNKFLRRAKELVPHKQLKVEESLAKIEKERADLFKQKIKFTKQENTYNKLIKDYDELLDELKNRKNIILKQAKEQALHILQNSNKEIEKTVKTIMETGLKNNQKNKRISNINEDTNETIKTNNLNFEHKLKAIQKKKIQKERNRLKTVESNYAKSLQKEKLNTINKTAPTDISNDKPQVGDKVCNKEQTVFGELISIKGKKGVIQSGIINIEIPLKNIFKSTKKSKKISKGYNVSYASKIVNSKNNFSKTLDIRGERVDAAMSKLVDYVDKAIMLKENHLTVVHGTGTGALKKMVHDYLNAHLSVSNIEFGHADRGGQGLTTFDVM